MPVYREEFEPIALPGEYIKVIGAGGKNNVKYFRVIAIEPLPVYEHDFGSINAGETKEKQEVQALYVPRGQLAQYRVRVIDNIRLYMYQPRSDSKFTTKKAKFYISPEIAGTDFVNLTEFYVFEDQSVYFDVENPGTSNLSNARVQFAGFKYVLEEVKEEPERYTTVAVQAL